jgi:glycosyltransferase involved in cell wall biosynthesis
MGVKSMNDNIQIDVLLATYNGEKYLRCQLDSILNQTHKNIRLLINDDCSTDGTIEILKEYETKDNRVKVQYNEKNLGYIKNFENLLKRVENNYFALSDQDDFWMENKIEKSLDKLLKENADLVFTDLEVVDENLKQIAPSLVKFMKMNKNIKKNHDYKLVFLRNCVTGCTILSKKELINKYIPVPKEEPMVHDWWMALIISQIGKVVFLEEPTIKYRQHGNNQLGIYGMKNYIQDFDEYREKYIDLKLNQFKLYIKNEHFFEKKELINLSKNAINYLENIKNKKYFNFRNLKTFFDLYNMEYFSMRLKTYLMLNLPILGRLMFNLRAIICKVKK